MRDYLKYEMKPLDEPISHNDLTDGELFDKLHALTALAKNETNKERQNALLEDMHEVQAILKDRRESPRTGDYLISFFREICRLLDNMGRHFVSRVESALDTKFIHGFITTMVLGFYVLYLLFEIGKYLWTLFIS